MSEKPDITVRLRHRLVRVHVPGEPFFSQDIHDPDAIEAAAEIERLRKIEDAARNVANTLNGGFIRCASCGDQEDTTDVDFANDLYAALGITAATK